MRLRRAKCSVRGNGMVARICEKIEVPKGQFAMNEANFRCVRRSSEVRFEGMCQGIPKLLFVRNKKAFSGCCVEQFLRDFSLLESVCVRLLEARTARGKISCGHHDAAITRV